MTGGKTAQSRINSLRLAAQVKKYSQKNPQGIEKMPEIGSNFRGRGLGNLGVVKFAKQYEQQGGHARYDVDCVRAGKQIKKAARRIGGQVDSLNHKLVPNQDLATEENEAQNCSYRPPRAECRSIGPRQTPAGDFQRDAAGK